MKSQYIGALLAFFSAFTYALGAVLVQLLEQAIPDLQLNFYRCIGQSILSGLLLAVKEQHPIVTGKKQILFTAVVAISGVVGSLLIFVSVLLIPVGSSGSLFHAGTLIFTLIGMWIFQMEQISRRKIMVFSLTLVGIALTLFSIIPARYFDDGVEEPQSNTSHVLIKYTSYENGHWTSKVMDNHLWMQSGTNHSLRNVTQLNSDHGKMNGFWSSQAFGIILALGSGLGQAGFIIGEKKALSCEPPVTGPVLSFWISAIGLPFSIALVPIIEKVTIVSDIGTILLVIGHAVSAGVSIILICLALERAPGVVVSLIMTADLPIRTLAQYLVIPDLQSPGGGVFDIIGSVVVLIALCLPGYWDLMDRRNEKRKISNGERKPLQIEKAEDK